MADINDCDICTYPELLAAAKAELAELESKKEQWKADYYCTLAKLNATERALTKNDKQLEQAKERLKMYKDGLCMATGEITDGYISEFLRSLPTGSIWYFIACKWDAKTLMLTAEREKREQADGEKENWIETAKRHCRNEEYYRNRAEQAEAKLAAERKQRRTDALDGQAALDELNNRLHRMEEALREIPENVLDMWVALEFANKPNIRTALINYVSELAKAALEDKP